MPTKKLAIFTFCGLLVILAGVAGGILWEKSGIQPVQASQAARQAKSSMGPTVEPVAGVPTPALAPGSTLLPQPTPYASAQWSQPPACANQPASSERLAAAASPGAAETDYRRAVRLSPALGSLKPDEFNTLLAGKNAEATAYTQRTLIGLAVNIATGRINRASSVSFSDLPEVKTVGDLLNRLEAGLAQGSAAPAVLKAAQQVQNGQGITQAVCARLLTTQTGGQTEDIRWATQGIQAQAVSAAQSIQQAPGVTAVPAIDTVTVSPDGRWAAYTSLGNDSGGPVLLLDLSNGAWTNLIDTINTNITTDPAKLPGDAWWDVIGWMPDSQRLVIGASDSSVILIADIHSGQYKAIPFEGGGVGGEMAVGLSPDGSQFAYIGPTAAGDGQVLSLYRLDSGQTTPLVTLPYSQGALYFPRFSPDGQTIAYITQKGRADQGQTETIARVAIATGSTTTLVEGALGLSLPAWSPDGRYLAFVRNETGPASPAPLDQPMKNVWVIDTTTGSAQQLTAIQGQALKPRWAPDAKTLAFVTHDGQIGLVSVSAPGKIWRAASPTSADPSFSNADFIP